MLYQKVFFLECIGRGRVGQIMMKADEGGGGVKQMLTIDDKGGQATDDCWWGREVEAWKPLKLADTIVDSPLPLENIK